MSLTHEDLLIFTRDKVLLKKNLISGGDLDKLLALANEIQELPETKGKWLQYFQEKESHRLLSRTENILPFFPQLQELFHEKILQPAKAILQDDVLVYKDKLIYKLPGSQGFQPHQDMAGYLSFEQQPHLIVLIAIDEADERNGCLQVIRGYKEAKDINHVEPELPHDQLLEWQQKGLWEDIKLSPGDVLFFGMYVPHRSAPNADQKGRSRRAFYLTLNKASEGDFREEYFRLKTIADPPDITTNFPRKPIKNK